MKDNTVKFKDFLVQCANPNAFDKTINALGAVLYDGGIKGDYIKNADGYYTMRVYGNSDFVIFAITNQGYGKVISEISTT